MLLEQQIYGNLKDSLKDIEGTVAIAINNHMGYKTVEEIIHISYTATLPTILAVMRLKLLKNK